MPEGDVAAPAGLTARPQPVPTGAIMRVGGDALVYVNVDVVSPTGAAGTTARRLLVARSGGDVVVPIERDGRSVLSIAAVERAATFESYDLDELPSAPEELPGLIDSWLIALHDALDEMTPTPEDVDVDAELDEGGDYDVEADLTFSTTAPLWRRPGGVMVDVVGGAGSADVWYPIVPGVQARTAAAGTMSLHSSEELARSGELAEALRSHHTRVGATLAEHDVQQATARRARLAARDAADSELVEATLERMGRTTALADLDAERDTLPQAPILAVLTELGRYQGFTVVGAPESASGRAVDPLEAIARASRIRVRNVTLDDGWWHRDIGAAAGVRPR